MRDIQGLKQIIVDLYELKKRLHYSLEELSKMFDCSTRTIRRWFNMENLPTQVYIPKIKKLLTIDKEKRKNYINKN